MTTPLIEAIARGLCRDGGLCVGFCHKSRCYSAIAAYGTQAQAALTAITEAGMVICPRDPTAEMECAMENTMCASDQCCCDHLAIYRAALGPLDTKEGE